MHARQHCEKLLQVTSTNAYEAWHGRLKNRAGLKKSEVSTHGIYGCVQTVHDCAHDVENNIESARLEANTRKVTLA